MRNVRKWAVPFNVDSGINNSNKLHYIKNLCNEPTAQNKSFCSWLRHYATSQKVAGSSPDDVDFFFQLT
jgi:hypothetical protein